MRLWWYITQQTSFISLRICCRYQQPVLTVPWTDSC